MNRETLNRYVAEGLVREQKHPTLPLSIFNYAECVQYDKRWDEVTLQCRGLVMSGDRVVARPFRKFFNDTEHAEGEIPWHLPCEVTEKMDGSLLILFHFEGQWHTATRGSFVSEQAIIGHDILREHYGFIDLDPAITYLFEVIYPGNRIVVDYGNRRDIVLLAMVFTETGEEYPLSQLDGKDIHWCVVRSLPPTASAKDLRALIRDDQEGYVVRFANGFRVKVKGAKYLELHRIYSGISSRLVWEHLSQERPLAEMLAILPDEFADWVKAERNELLSQYDLLSHRVEQAYLDVRKLPTRKEQALVIFQEYDDISSAVFAALDNKPVAPVLWKRLYPEHRRPARVVEMLA